MKKLLIGLAFFASPVNAESLCGEMDRQVLLDALAGEWQTLGLISIDSEIFSLLENVHGNALLEESGRFSSKESPIEGERPSVYVDENSVIFQDLGQVYDVDQVDDMIETVEADWIADEVSMTPCGPEGLLQLSTPVTIVDEVQSTLTLLPYFTDKIVVISEEEAKGEWGIAYVTKVTLLTRE